MDNSDRILTDTERSLLIAVNGEPWFAELNDESLLWILSEKLIRETIGRNERTEELIRIRNGVHDEF